ncbi:MAG: FTR1 family protein [Chloroflexota bacterium]
MRTTKSRAKFWAFSAALMLILLLMPLSIAWAQSTAPWERAEAIRSAGVDAQRELFRPEPDTELIAGAYENMESIYVEDLSADYKAAAPEIDTKIMESLTDAKAAAADQDGVAFSLARGEIWSNLLHGSYLITLNALENDDAQKASEWLRLREYRRSTIVNVVTSPADAAMQQVLRGGITAADAALIVDSDLRDTTFFRLREAISELEDASASEFQTRAAEWAGKLDGYFGLLESDFVAKQGSVAANDIRQLLLDTNNAAIGADWSAINQNAEALRQGFSNYQPVAFTEDQLGERSQLLYLYTELIWIEYRDAVRNGEISIDIEYQETITFRNQAVAVYEELRPILAANDPEGAVRLAEIYAEIEAIVEVIGPRPDVEVLVAEATGLIETGLSVDPNANDAGAAMFVIEELLTQVSASVAAGNYEMAENQRVEAYAFFETGPEVKLANQAPRLAREIEGIFWEGTGGEEGLAAMIRNEEPLEVIDARLVTLRGKLAEAEPFLAAENAYSIAFISSIAIIIREGLEAVLIIGAILGFMRMSEETKKYVWWVVTGVVAAIALSFGIWWASTTFLPISFSNRELLEGITALVAVAVLFYVTNWLFQKAYVGDWMSFVKEQVGNALTSGSAFGLAFLGFTVVFREGFETVLFYQTLLFDSDPQAVLYGFLIGSGVIAVVAFLILRMSVRLPLKPFFNVTTVLLLVMAFNFVGKGFRGLQEAGVVNATWLSWIPENLVLIEVFGIYPTVETTTAQFAFVLLVIITFGWSLIQSNQQKKEASVAAD